jgi:hypothetical protein
LYYTQSAVEPDSQAPVFTSEIPSPLHSPSPRGSSVAADNADLTLQAVAIETLGADTLAHGSVVGDGHTGKAPEKVKDNVAVHLPGNSQVAEGEKLALRITDGMLH